MGEIIWLNFKEKLTQIYEEENKAFYKENPHWCCEEKNDGEMGKMHFCHEHDRSHLQTQSNCEHKKLHACRHTPFFGLLLTTPQRQFIFIVLILHSPFYLIDTLFCFVYKLFLFVLL